MSRSVAILAAMLAALLATPAAQAEVYEVYPTDDLFTILENLSPGDEVIVHEGTYITQQGAGSWFRSYEWHGAEADPILIHAAEGENAVLEGDPGASQNILNLEGTWFTFAGFELMYGSHGIRLGEAAHVVFEDLHIHETGDVGFSANYTDNTYQDVTLRGNEIDNTHGTGECFYLGCNDGACTMFDSLIEFNYCHHTQSTSQGDGIELKTGSYNCIVRHNVIHDVNYPGITMYGTFGEAPNIVEGNVVWNSIDNGIQLVGDAIVRNNLVLNAGANGIHSKPSQGNDPRELEIVNNTVVGAGDSCLRGNNWDGGESGSILVANNAFYCGSTTAIRLAQGGGSATFAANAVLGTDEAPGGTFAAGAPADDLVDPSGMDLYPAVGSSLIDSGDDAYGAVDDFNCLDRETGVVDVGAYEWSEAENPGWPVQEDFKQCEGSVDSDSDTDTDSDSDSDSDADSDTDADTDADSDTDAGATGGDGGDDSCGCRAVGESRAAQGLLALLLTALS